MEELKEYQEKSHQIGLVYTKVMRNVRNISKNYEDADLPIENTNSNNDIELVKTENENTNLEISKSKSKHKSNEDDVIKKYEQYLKQMKNVFMEYLNNNSEEEFINLMRNEGLKDLANEKNNKNMKKINNLRLSASDLKPIPDHNEEYDYSDNEVYDEELKIKMEYDELAREFKDKVYYIFYR